MISNERHEVKIYNWFLKFFGTDYYNYQWSDHISYIDGWIPKLAFSVPIIGYLILFNDKIGGMMVFQVLANEDNDFGLSDQARFRLVYFGLIFLGVSNMIYRIKKPYCFRYATSLKEYITYALDNFTIFEFRDMHYDIRNSGHLTMHGKTYDYQWDDFYDEVDPTKDSDNHDWQRSISKYRDTLLMLMHDNFFRQSKKRRGWLTVCLILSTMGYAFLAVPSLDLLTKVLKTLL